LRWPGDLKKAMNIRIQFPGLKWLKSTVDWKLLLFLLLFLDVKLAVKIFAIAAIYLLQPDFKFGFNFKNPRLPLFYPAVIAIALLDAVISTQLASPNYILVLLTGIGFWALCILAVHQVKLFVEGNDVDIVHNTLKAFFVINAACSAANLLLIILHTHALNPYLYQGEYQKYFLSTGDFIKGITFDTSTTNAIINAFGVMYFLSRKDALMTIVCMVILLLAGSNITNIVLLGILAFQFLFKTSRDQKSILTVCLLLLMIFMGRVSPQNSNYVVNTVEAVVYQKEIPQILPDDRYVKPLWLRPDNELNVEQRRQKIAKLYVDSVDLEVARRKKPDPIVKLAKLSNTGELVVPKPDINGPFYQWLQTTPPEQKQLADFVKAHKAELPISGRPFHFTAIPGKITGLLQTLNFYKQHPAKTVSGDGMGNFSSKLAFRATGLNFTGGYPAKYAYINPLFMANHLDVYLRFFSSGPGFHSLTNSPFSVYDQVLAEYGLLGVLSLVLLYCWFFARHYKKLSYGISLMVFVAAMFFVDYWFEQLSVMVLFEMMMFLNIKENAPTDTGEPKTAVI
jgi:hypothetical protein